MFNILLDAFPDNWKGCKINTDFRIGIMICLASSDAELSETDKANVIMNLLFDDEIPDEMEIAECVDWFLNGWTHDRHSKGSGVSVMDFDSDDGRIYTAFLSQYGIDLNTAEMHFWRFMHLLTNLEECAFTRVIDIRAKKIDGKMSKEERKYYTDAKRIYAINKDEEKSIEQKIAEQEVTDEFLSFIQKK